MYLFRLMEYNNYPLINYLFDTIYNLLEYSE